MTDDADTTPPTPPVPSRSRGIGRRELLALVALFAISAAAAALLIHGPAKAKLPDNAGTSRTQTFDGLTVTPTPTAPPLALTDYTGAPVNIAAYRGKAVLVTFIYSHCPDVCPLIVANLHAALLRLGSEASRVQVIAVSVDPRGDTQKAVSKFVAIHGMTGRMKYLLGTAPQLAKVWEAWNVGSSRDEGNPDFVSHTALVYGIDATGKIRTIYQAAFNPAEVVHDVPELAAT